MTKLFFIISVSLFARINAEEGVYKGSSTMEEVNGTAVNNGNIPYPCHHKTANLNPYEIDENISVKLFRVYLKVDYTCPYLIKVSVLYLEMWLFLYVI